MRLLDDPHRHCEAGEQIEPLDASVSTGLASGIITAISTVRRAMSGISSTEKVNQDVVFRLSRDNSKLVA
jgi:hypothetical protein